MSKTNSTGISVLRFRLGYFPVRNRAGKKLAEDWELCPKKDSDVERYPNEYAVRERLTGLIGRSLTDDLIKILENHKDPDTEEAEVDFTIEVVILEEDRRIGLSPADSKETNT